MNQGSSRGVSLDSLLQMIHIKGDECLNCQCSLCKCFKPSVFFHHYIIIGIDKKTTILDYVVKNLFDKGEESILTIVKDLHLLDDFSKLSAREALEEVAAVNEKLADLERECNNGRNRLNNRPSSRVVGDHHHGNEHSEMHDFDGSKLPPPVAVNPQSTSKVLASQFSINLENNLIVFRDVAKEVNRSADILNGKLNELIEYFGEEPTVCDTVQIFGALQQFKLAVASSKENVEWRISRTSNHNNHSSSSSSSSSSLPNDENHNIISHNRYSET